MNYRPPFIEAEVPGLEGLRIIVLSNEEESQPGEIQITFEKDEEDVFFRLEGPWGTSDNLLLQEGTTDFPQGKVQWFFSSEQTPEVEGTFTVEPCNVMWLESNIRNTFLESLEEGMLKKRLGEGFDPMDEGTHRTVSPLVEHIKRTEEKGLIMLNGRTTRSIRIRGSKSVQIDAQRVADEDKAIIYIRKRV